jgi:hypothetical protein
VVEASICDAEFANSLRDIADLVRPPTGVVLQTIPAAGVVTQLRLAASDGTTAHVCVGPPDPAAEWAFIDCTTAALLPPGAVSKCIKLAPGAGCEPSGGQTLVAEYLGRIPQGGCPVPAGAANQPSTECATALGGVANDWTCDGTPTQTGTCLCRTE